MHIAFTPSHSQKNQKSNYREVGDHLYIIPKNYKEATKVNTWIQQICRVQGEHTEISCFQTATNILERKLQRQFHLQ